MAAADLNLSRLVELGVSPIEEAFSLLAKQVRTLDRSKERKVHECTKTIAAYKTATKVREGGEKCDTVRRSLKANQQRVRRNDSKKENAEVRSAVNSKTRLNLKVNKIKNTFKKKTFIVEHHKLALLIYD